MCIPDGGAHARMIKMPSVTSPVVARDTCAPHPHSNTTWHMCARGGWLAHAPATLTELPYGSVNKYTTQYGPKKVARRRVKSYRGSRTRYSAVATRRVGRLPGPIGTSEGAGAAELKMTMLKMKELECV